MISVVLADDHALVREGLRRLLDEAHDMHLVAEASDGAALLEIAREHSPDIALVDISMPRVNGLEAARQLRDTLPDTKVIILTMHDADEFVARSIKAGVSGFLPKDTGFEQLTTAIRRVADGGRFFATQADESEYDRAMRSEVEAPRLSARQKEVLMLLANGHTSREIGEELGLSTRTVESHRRNIAEALRVDDLTGLIRYAVRQGLIEP